MKVILLEDVAGTGKAGDVVNVANGYARNKLIPSGIALEANKNNMKTLEHRRVKLAAKRAEDVAAAQVQADAIEGKELVFIAKVGEAGKLFGSITSQDIANKLNDEFGFEIDKKKVELNLPIKEIGVHEVPIKIFTEVVATVKVFVESEAGQIPEAVEEPAEEVAEETVEEVEESTEDAE